MKKCFLALLILLLVTGESLAVQWSFVAIGDNRSAYPTYKKVLEKIRGLRETEGPGKAQFIIACGDISPFKENNQIFREVFKENKTLYLPVRGNHEKSDDLEFIKAHCLQASGSKLKQITNFGFSYYLDWNDVRVIVLDQYSSAGKNLGHPALLSKLDELLGSGRGIKHVFLAYHEPNLPLDPANDPFWSLLMKYKKRVKGVFCGHYHLYHRKFFPKMDGILYVNVGNAGWTSHSDYKQTVVDVSVEDKGLNFRTFQAPDGTTEYKVTDQWQMPAN